MLYRIISLKERSVIFFTCLVMAATFLFCQHELQLIRSETVTEQVPIVKHSYLILPDQLVVSSNVMRAQARDCQTGEKVNIIYFIKSEQELRQVKAINQATICQITGDKQPLEPATNFNQFDSAAYYRQLHIYNQVKCRTIQFHTYSQPNLIQRCHVLRAKLYRYFEDLPHPLSGYCQQLILGMKNPQNDDLMRDVKRLGLLHLFCISGMHVVLLVTSLRKVLIRCHCNYEDIDWLLIVVLPFYLIIAGGSVSLVRAVIMAEMSLINRVTRLSSLDGWAISLLGGLVMDPWLLMTLGGQLSYLLSFSLHVLPATFTSFQRSLLLNLISLPSILAFTYEFHILTFICSFVVIPIFSVVIFPAVILSSIGYFFLPGLAFLTNGLLRIFDNVLGILSDLPGIISFGKPALLISWLMFIITLVLIDRLQVRRVVLLAMTYLLAFLLIHFPLYGEINFVDIGQGDSTIIRYPFSNHVEMIDTGGKLNFGKRKQQSKIDNATRTSVNYLKSCGIKKIQTIYLSHHDVDHIGYLPTILRNFNVEQIVVPKGMENQRALLRLIPADSLTTPEIIPVTAGKQINHSQLAILHPFEKGEGKNEDSVVLWGQFGQLSFMFMGDLDRNGERKICRRQPSLRSDILKLGHHGSRTASDPQFIAQLQPKFGIISAGRQNRYGHPNQETLDTLGKYNVRPVSTQRYGMIRYRWWGNNYNWQTKLKGDEYQWMLTPSKNR